MTTTTLTPTAEQDQAIGLFLSGRPLVIEAGAGTGKTSTLTLLAQAAPHRRVAYVAFNRAIVDDSAAKMPANVTARTMHSHAFGAVGRRFAHRLRSKRLPTMQQVRILGIDPITIRYGTQSKVLQPGFLVGRVVQALRNFCQSADPVPGVEHFPYIDGIDEPREGGRRGWANNRMVAEALLPALGRAWADARNPDGQLRYDHGYYLKVAQLEGMRMPVDVVMFDEAQDASPVMLDIVAQQGAHGAQLVYVGDSQQAIYEWLGAVNALGRLDGAERSFLTQSWRFGPAVADVANEVLARLDAELRITGNPGMDSLVTEVAAPTCLLTRTNATAVRNLFQALADERRPHLVGGGDDVLRFARAVIDLQDKGWTSHPELACFTTWGQVQDYVAQDEQGADLALLVKLVDDFGADDIVAALEQQVPESRADVVLSTAHKSKGREWATVKLADDFPTVDDDGLDDDLEPAELRLLYVAATRARHQLDITSVPALSEGGEPPVTVTETG